MKAIKKLKEHKIFGEDSIVETFIEKQLWGTPFFKKARLRVKNAKDEYKKNSCNCRSWPCWLRSSVAIGRAGTPCAVV